MGKTVDARSDIFSAGGVFYEFLTGQKPFKGKTLHSVLYQIISGEPDPVLTLNPELPARLALIVHRMLVKDPDKRYSSMEEPGRELRALEEGLRRRGRPATALAPDEARARVHDAISRGRGHLDSGEHNLVRAEMREALALDPENNEAAELLWRAERALRHSQPAAPRLDAESDARVAQLLGRAAPGQPDDKARHALAELALIAPDDPRVTDLLRERAGKG